MSTNPKIQSLLTAAQDAAREELLTAERQATRIAWGKEQIEAPKEAHKRLDEAWDRIFDALPDDLSDEELEAMDIPDPPEQAEVDAILAPLADMRDRGIWPRELH